MKCKKIINVFLIIFAIIVALTPVFVILYHLTTYPKPRVYSKEILKENLISIEIVYIGEEYINNGYEINIVRILSEEETSQMIEDISNIEFGFAGRPRSALGQYAAKFNYADGSLLISALSIVEIDLKGNYDNIYDVGSGGTMFAETIEKYLK